LHPEPREGDIVAMKTLTVRLEDEKAQALDTLAMAEGASVSQVIRDAIDTQIEKRRNDKAFQERLQRAYDRNKAAFDLLAK
jgi:predicted transcriptional regulator